MANYQSVRSSDTGALGARIDEGLRAHMNKVYGTMSVGMLLTAAAAWAFGSTPKLMALLYTVSPNGGLQMNMLGWAVMFAPLIMVFGLSAGINRISAATAQLVFYIYAAVMGVSLSWIMIAYTGYSVAQTFLVTSIAFAGLSLYGYTTKRNLSAMGSFLMMGVIGLLVAMVVNLFLQSSAMGFAISAIGVLIFAGLTAYDTQKIKSMYFYVRGTDFVGKSVVMGALTLYLDFVNMFTFLLNLMGSRD